MKLPYIDTKPNYLLFKVLFPLQKYETFFSLFSSLFMVWIINKRLCYNSFFYFVLFYITFLTVWRCFQGCNNQHKVQIVRFEIREESLKTQIESF